MNQISKETREYLRSIASKGGKKAAANMSAAQRQKRAETASAKAADKRRKTKNSKNAKNA